MPFILERKDYDFLLRSERFCANIDKYLNRLELDWPVVEGYKYDNRLMLYVFNNIGNYESSVESFTRLKIKEMRAGFAELVALCKNSERYSFAIGAELGLETQEFLFGDN